MEIIAVRGSAKEAQKLADMLKAVRGVKHATLGMSSTGKHIK
jgi:metal-responsive CopG/Arc/MetJ family transcriptional regulator